MKNLLEINELELSFSTPDANIPTLNGVSLAVAENSVSGLIGESGAGKSTLACAVTRLNEKTARITGGSVRWDGKEILGYSEKQMGKLREKDIRLVLQNSVSCLDPVFTIGSQLKESVRLCCGLRGRKAALKAAEMLRLVGIGEPEKRMRQYPFEFSGGMRQRVSLAMALAGRPRLLIADEPTAELDSTIQAQIIELLKTMREQTGLSMLIISHDLGVAAEIADVIYVMTGGRIVESAPSRELFSHPAHPYTQSLLESFYSLENGIKKQRDTGKYPPYIPSAKGCPFALKCPYCLKVCLAFRPPDTTVSEGHLAACWLYDNRGAGQKAVFEKRNIYNNK